MSGKQSGLVWDHVITGNKRLVLLALAEAAEHDGTRCYPSIGRLAWMTGLGRRTVQRAIDYLSSPEVGVLVRVRDEQPRRPTEWRLEVQRLPRKAPFRRGDRGERVGAKVTPWNDRPEGVPSATPQGANGDVVGASLVAPDPSSYSSDDSSESVISRWIEIRRDLARHRFIDERPLRSLRSAVNDALQRGVPANLVRRTIEEAARRTFANPLDVDDGVVAWLRAAEEEHEHEQCSRRAAQERAAAERDHDAAIEAERAELRRQYPGLTWSQIVARVAPLRAPEVDRTATARTW